MDAELREFVRSRAGHRCEYCRISQESEPYYRFHIEHIIARQHGGSDHADNLALSCHHCNFHKGPDLTAVDPESSQIVPLLHPRRDQWNEHFALRGALIIGVSPTGRATVRLLAMNATSRLELREAAQI